MKPERRKAFAKLIAEEVADNIRTDESIRRKLEMLTDLPVERVVEELVKQIDYLLTKQVREIVEGPSESEPENSEDEKHVLAGGVGYLVTEKEEEEEAALNEDDLADLSEGKASKEEVEDEETFELKEIEPDSVLEEKPEEEVEEEVEESAAVAEKEEEPATIEGAHEEVKDEQKISPALTESAIKKGLANVLAANDWVYVYGFGVPSKSARSEFRATNLKSKGVDGEHHIYLLDAADVSLYVSKLSAEDYFIEKSGKLVIAPQKAREYQYEHEWILNKLRSVNVIVPLPFWTLVKGTDALARLLTSEKKGFIDAAAMLQGTREWKVEVFALDTFLSRLSEIIGTSKGREASETKPKSSSRIDIKVQEKVLFKEKSLATEIYEKLSKLAADGKLLQSAGLQSAFLDDWKPILLARYTLDENRHLQFCKAVTALQDEYSAYQLMIRTTNPSVEFTFPL